MDMNIQTPDSLGTYYFACIWACGCMETGKMEGNTIDNKAGDFATVDVIGVNASGIESVLYTLNTSQQDFDISSVSPVTYPYIKLSMRNADSINFTPYQLRYWRILYDPVPEGALAPNILYNFKDTLNSGELVNFQMAFKNVSDCVFYG
jgi:hypothetical protein